MSTTKRPYPPRAYVVHTLQSLHAKCEEVGNCWEWQGSYTGNGHPAGRHNKVPVLVRRLAYTLAGKTIPAGHIVVGKCGNSRCINPDCSTTRTEAQHMQQMGRMGKMNDLVRSAKIAATKRAQCAKITMAQVQEIRTSTENTREAGQRYGLHPSRISAIRRHKIWRDYSSNPFAGLGARA